MSPLERQPNNSFALTVKSLARSVGGQAVNAKWTSYGALEIDVLVEARPDFQVFLATTEPLATLEFTRDLNEPPKFKPKDETISKAIEYFNGERFWEAHEELEAIWRSSTGPEKTLLQGLILVCAAFVHVQKGEQEVARSILRRADKQLVHSTTEYHGIEVRKLKLEVEGILESEHFHILRI